MSLSITLYKDRQKFSAAHMTIFSKNTKERLHGHNYRVQLEVGLKEKWIPFATFKSELQRICDLWDEKLLLAGRAPQMTLEDKGTSYEFSLCGKEYKIPKEEVAILPIANVTLEELSKLFCEELWKGLGGKVAPEDLSYLEISIEETLGQIARFRLEPS